MSEIDLFFAAPPDTGAGQGNIRSILYLLRRDLRDLSCPESQEIPSESRIVAPVLAAAGINIGFEVLGRIWTGEDDPGQAKLVNAYQEILQVSKELAEVLLHFRNSLMHGYQLEINARRARGVYRFCLHTNLQASSFFERTQRNGIEEYRVSFWELRRKFLKAINTVYVAVRNEGSHRNKFESVLPYLRPYVMNNGPDLSKSHN